jgi:hypothetical protein
MNVDRDVDNALQEYIDRLQLSMQDWGDEDVAEGCCSGIDEKTSLSGLILAFTRA